MNHTPALIAVVDDEAPLRKAIWRALRLADYEAAQYTSGEEFLGSMPQAQPACAVIDVHMPGLSGFDVASVLHGQGAPIPIVLITASDEPALGQRATALGAPLLRKPFAMDALLDAIRTAMARATPRT